MSRAESPPINGAGSLPFPTRCATQGLLRWLQAARVCLRSKYDAKWYALQSECHTSLARLEAKTARAPEFERARLRDAMVCRFEKRVQLMLDDAQEEWEALLQQRGIGVLDAEDMLAFGVSENLQHPQPVRPIVPRLPEPSEPAPTRDEALPPTDTQSSSASISEREYGRSISCFVIAEPARTATTDVPGSSSEGRDAPASAALRSPPPPPPAEQKMEQAHLKLAKASGVTRAPAPAAEQLTTPDCAPLQDRQGQRVSVRAPRGPREDKQKSKSRSTSAREHSSTTQGDTRATHTPSALARSMSDPAPLSLSHPASHSTSNPASTSSAHALSKVDGAPQAQSPRPSKSEVHAIRQNSCVPEATAKPPEERAVLVQDQNGLASVPFPVQEAPFPKFTSKHPTEFDDEVFHKSQAWREKLFETRHTRDMLELYSRQGRHEDALQTRLRLKKMMEEEKELRFQYEDVRSRREQALPSKDSGEDDLVRVALYTVR
ncbi:hypothetical protein HDZ31DRAFT_66378 [Schizophyllum fasciatum]